MKERNSLKIMNTSKLSDYLKYNIMSFKVTGIWIDVTNLKEFTYKKIVYCFVVNLLFLFAPQICHVIYMYKARDNVEAFADEFYVSMSSLIVVFKSYSLVRHFAIIHKLIESMDEDIFQPRNEYQEKQTKSIMGTWQKIYWYFTFLDFNFCLMHLVSPIIDSIRNGTKLLPLVDCYPFPIFISPTYEIMYVYQTFVLFSLCWQNYNMDTLITGLLSFAALQCDILCDNLKNLRFKRGVEHVEMEKLRRNFIVCIEHYNKINRFVKDIEFCFSWNILEQFACSVITFCTTMFKISLTEPMSKEFFTIICYQGACFLELFIFCLAGAELAAKSDKISSAAYFCDWVNTSKPFKTTLLNFTQKAQKPLIMRAVLFPVSLDIFVQIVKSSFSYYTMLSTLNEK